MTEADINCLLVKAGDVVKADEPLVEVQTDKMTAEIPAPRPGIIKNILIEAGQSVKVGTTLLIMEDLHEASGTQSEHEYSFQSGQSAGISSAIQPHPVPGRILASPYTRKIARELGIDLSAVQGSGPSGRILDEDVLALSQAKEPVIKKEISSPEKQKTRESFQRKDAGKDIIPFRGRRKQIGKAMVSSVYTIPHCTHFEEIDVTGLMDIREELKASGRPVSASCFFIKALSIALTEFPVFNAELDEEEESIRLIKEHHIGIAVDAPQGLIVPVLRHVEKKNLRVIGEEMKELTRRALEDGLSARDISGGTFTISNVGPLGGSIGATPIIQYPQTALVSFHKTKKRPVVTDQDEIAIRSIMNISMSFDHRVADGASAVKFTNRFAELIENPKLLFLELI
ncbi:dihydrolipoamide acetyltransferase family protein [Peribacillus sp. SCS-37]|uniref:dihydrolipoamide acetyltransferase family protein n=1 Tax=Paraperibacillus esterisolvens TaxID=3115296 RepID=UPI0039063B9A